MDLDFFSKLLFPPKCPGCLEVLKPDERAAGFCRECVKKVSFISSQYCLKCGLKLKKGESSTYCRSCTEHSKDFDVARSTYLYKGVVKDAMYSFKYDNMRSFAEMFARDMARLHGREIMLNAPQVIIPVPMYKKKQRKRGYNQAEVLAKALGKCLSLPVDSGYIVRIEDTLPMKELGRSGRVENLENAFQIANSSVKYERVILVDDIYTTGSTLEAVTRVVKRAGVNGVYCMTACGGISD